MEKGDAVEHQTKETLAHGRIDYDIGVVICHTPNTWHYCPARASQEKRPSKRRGQGGRGTPPMKCQQKTLLYHRTSIRFASSEETFRPTGGSAVVTTQPRVAVISPRDGRFTRSPSRPPRGAQGARPFPHRAHRRTSHTGVELDVPRSFFPAQGFAADFRLRLRGCGERPRRPPRSCPGR